MSAAPERAKSIFLKAVEAASDEERRAYLDAACGDDTALRREVEGLLTHHGRLGAFLEAPAADPAGTGAFTPGEAAPEPRNGHTGPGEAVGAVIGPYKLVQEIGEGGMGSVYLAEQHQPVRRLVALKVIKAGMDSRQVLARFEAERQALALMDHPHIARVLDAGTTAGGRPYFVMELIKGVPITRYCDEHRLTPRQRLELFVPVCQAIQHAHQKGIIHRDVKPSNVLVALYDGKPVPKVIDFGIAKAAGQPLTERTLVTGFGNVVGTLEYMSPEQAELNQLDIDTRSDVYSLGVLLYELLTGTTPLEKKRLKEAALLEVLRIIREEEPPRPSTRLSTTDELPAVAANRGLEPRQLSGLVRGELDWIVMKALEKDRGRRYDSANGLALDLQRYLADEPVLACPPSAAYRLRKFARRNRGRLAAAAGLCFLLAAVLGSVGWAVRDRAVREEEKQREQAARQARAANELALALDRAEFFLKEGKRAESLAALGRAELLAGEAPANPARDARLVALREQLAAQARDEEFLARFEDIRLRVQSQVNVAKSLFTPEAAYPEIRDALDHYGITIGATSAPLAAARVLDRPAAARQELIAALNECLALAPADNVQARQWLLAVLTAADPDPWRVQVRQAAMGQDWKRLELLDLAADPRKHPPSFLLLAARSLPATQQAARLELLRRIQRAYPADLWANHDLAFELHADGRPAEAVRYYTAALVSRPDNAGLYVNRGFALKDAGELDAAVADFREAAAFAPGYAMPHHNLGVTLQIQGRLEEAIAEYREAIRIKKDYAEAHCNLGSALQDKGRFDEAIAECREAIRLHKDDAVAHNNLGNALRAAGRLDQAVAECREALRLRKGYPEAYLSLGVTLQAACRLDEAIAAYRDAIRVKKPYPEAHSNLGTALWRKGCSDEAVAQYREAIAEFGQAVAGHRGGPQLKEDYACAHYNLGNALLATGRLDQAIAAYREALRLQVDFDTYYNLGNALRAKGQLDEAVNVYREAIRLKNDDPGAHCNLGLALCQRGEFRQALKELRRGQELGSRDPRRACPSAEWIRQCERLAELDERLPGLLAGNTAPASPAERVELAALCSLKHLNRAAARFYAEAFTAEPKLAEHLEGGYRYNAACAAALAGCGEGKDAGRLDAKERARLRGLALGWLRADLDAWGRLRRNESNQPGSRSRVAEALRHWLADPDLAGVRGAPSLARLPEAERQPWQKLWDDVAALLAGAQGKTTPEKQADAK